MRAKKVETIDDYLATLTADKRSALQKLRKAIKAAAPRAEECISYRMPAFRLDGKVIVWMGAASRHCAFYPGAFAIEVHKYDLRNFSTSKGTVRFTPDHPLSAALVKKLVRARIAKQQS